MSVKPTGKKVEREARLRWVPLKETRVNPLAQRELNPARVDKIASEMELEQLGNPTVNWRGEAGKAAAVGLLFAAGAAVPLAAARPGEVGAWLPGVGAFAAAC